ncbi:hypothetical protein H1P_1800009 [Hyella patelloides LEGE 07179]|uniref:Uncharacterized protein n=1 Tax=Hyella patelloides LEGE 07179 TaxID=945734 RepID=A0A563VNQ9_9CYAN|nr:hypothetical protein H1P_1800009 [Hyella patelloides LEGE 07179]
MFDDEYYWALIIESIENRSHQGNYAVERLISRWVERRVREIYRGK